MPENKLESLIEDFNKAVSRLDEVLRKEKSEIIRDSAIKRFEMAFDLSWKTLKTFLEDRHNAICVSPRNCFREAFRVGLIDYDEYWLELAKIRNLTVHTYSEVLAEKIYADLKRTPAMFKKLISAIEAQNS